MKKTVSGAFTVDACPQQTMVIFTKKEKQREAGRTNKQTKTTNITSTLTNLCCLRHLSKAIHLTVSRTFPSILSPGKNKVKYIMYFCMITHAPRKQI